MQRALWLALPLILWVAACRAGDGTDCRNAATQAEMNQCAANDLTRADDALNHAYNALLAALEPARRGRLIQAQRSWAAVRDTRCRSETAGSSGGSIRPLLYDSCLADATRKRTKDLQISLDCRLHGRKCDD